MQKKKVNLDKEYWYENAPELLETSHESNVTILWNKVQTDKSIHINKPDIIICDNEKDTYVLTDAANSGDRNVIKKEAEKILKHKTLQYKYSACEM